MRFLRGVFALLKLANRPLPAWLTLILIFGTASAVALPSAITQVQAVNADVVMQTNGTGPHLDHSLIVRDLAGSKPNAADSLADVSVFAPNLNTRCPNGAVSQMWPGIVGGSVGNYGGYWVFFTKNDGLCSGAEVLVLDAQQHLFMPNDSTEWRFTTPVKCSAGAVCTTWTWRFTKPFLTISGGTEVPRCSAPGIMDESDAGRVWAGNIKSVSSSQVVYNLVPLQDAAGSDTLDVYATCHDQGY